MNHVSRAPAIWGEGERRAHLATGALAISAKLLRHAAVEIVPQSLPLIPIFPAAPEQVSARD